jgi:hypothetical protein
MEIDLQFQPKVTKKLDGALPLEQESNWVFLSMFGLTSA